MATAIVLLLVFEVITGALTCAGDAPAVAWLFPVCIYVVYLGIITWALRPAPATTFRAPAEVFVQSGQVFGFRAGGRFFVQSSSVGQPRDPWGKSLPWCKAKAVQASRLHHGTATLPNAPPARGTWYKRD